MHKLEEELRRHLSSGLKRSAIKSCSSWACSYRVMGQPYPGKFTFNHHPWAKEMHDCKSEMMVGMKAAQMAFTETALDIALYKIDMLGISVLYILPASIPDARDFSTSRFDTALENSPYLKDMFSDTKNIHHKRAGNANLYIRGSRSRSQLKSIPVGLVILDEVDEMMQDNIPLASERMSGQVNKQEFRLSTPTIEKFGIHSSFRETTQEEYFFKCPHCSKLSLLIFPECLVITADELTDPKIRQSYLRCKECGHRLEHETKNEWLGWKNSSWVPKHPDRLARGFHISQLYSMTEHPWKIASNYLRALTSPADEQEFYNSKLGITHTVKGAKLGDDELAACTGEYQTHTTSPKDGIITLGVDVGRWLHYEIDHYLIDKSGIPDINLITRCRILKTGKLEHFEELDALIRQFGVMYCVIDAHPEKRKAYEFAERFYGYASICYYGNNIKSKQISEDTMNHSVTVDRTSWLDVSLGRFRNTRITMPVDTSLEYKEQVKAPTRIYLKDADGNPISRYVTGSEPDHFAHARNYAEIALPLAAKLMGNQDLYGIL